MEKHHYFEEAINEIIKDVFAQRKDICKCEQCKQTIKDTVIKRLSANHQNTPPNKLHSRVQGVDMQLKADVAKEVFAVIEQTKQTPNHF